VVLPTVVVFQMFEVSAEGLFGELFKEFDPFEFIDVKELMGPWLVAVEGERGEETGGRDG